MEYEFTEMRETMQTLRSTRLLITPHGAGMSNLVFMRPGASVLETDGYMCGFQGHWYGQLARILSLNHRVWEQLKRIDSGDSCNFHGHITLDIDQVVTAARDMLAQESSLRDGHLQDAVQKVVGLTYGFTEQLAVVSE
jgi:capsular polysaccharide biosynthesis protein